MEPFTPSTFGELNADDYDALHDPGTTQDTVDLVSELAGGGSILELAVGTGRIALPLAARGHEVSGIEGSPDMIAKLREKPHGDTVAVTQDDIADFALGRSFDHVCLVFNTLFNLQSQDEQINCFKCAADHLKNGGTFLIETFVPDFHDYTGGQRVRLKSMDRSSAWIDLGTHDAATQVLEFQRIRITSEGARLVPLRMRYAWPAEIDLMARLAGLTLEDRWGGWKKEPFTADSSMHISVYRK